MTSVSAMVAQAALKTIADKAAKQLKTNDMFDHTRMGGVWTANGLEQAAANAQLDGADKNMAKAVIQSQFGQQDLGIGGSTY